LVVLKRMSVEGELNGPMVNWRKGRLRIGKCERI
jgi:hypothetical protein